MIAIYVEAEPVERVKAGALDMLDSILRENPGAAREIDAMAGRIPDRAAANGKTRRVLEVEGSIRISYARGPDIQHSRGCGEDRAG